MLSAIYNRQSRHSGRYRSEVFGQFVSFQGNPYSRDQYASSGCCFRYYESIQGTHFHDGWSNSGRDVLANLIIKVESIQETPRRMGYISFE